MCKERRQGTNSRLIKLNQQTSSPLLSTPGAEHSSQGLSLGAKTPNQQRCYRVAKRPFLPSTAEQHPKPHPRPHHGENPLKSSSEGHTAEPIGTVASRDADWLLDAGAR
ncbi:unnamed protein product [Gadus morhua 'NCC']